MSEFSTISSWLLCGMLVVICVLVYPIIPHAAVLGGLVALLVGLDLAKVK